MNCGGFWAVQRGRALSCDRPASLHRLLAKADEGRDKAVIVIWWLSPKPLQNALGLTLDCNDSSRASSLQQKGFEESPCAPEAPLLTCRGSENLASQGDCVARRCNCVLVASFLPGATVVRNSNSGSACVAPIWLSGSKMLGCGGGSDRLFLLATSS